MTTDYEHILDRRNTAAGAASNNAILMQGEVGLETDTGKKKTGDGVTHWNDLKYDTDPAVVETVNEGRLSEAALNATIGASVAPVAAKAIDDSAIVRLAAIGASDASASVAGRRFDWETASGWTEDFADLSKWVSGGNLAATGGVVYNTLAGSGAHGARRPFSGGAGDFIVRGVFNVTGTAPGAFVIIGVTDAAASDGSDIASEHLSGIGINASGAPSVYWKGAQTAIGSGGTGHFYINGEAQASGTVLPAGTYYLTHVTTAYEATWTLVNAAETVYVFASVGRTGSSYIATPTGIAIFNQDSNLASGIGIRNIVVRAGRLTGNPRGGAESEANRVERWQVTSTGLGDAFTADSLIQLPAAYDARMPFPVVIYCHGSGDEDELTMPATKSNGLGALLKALVDAGFIVASSDFGGTTNWGNPNALTAMQDLYRTLRDSYSIGPIGFLCNSMGSQVALNTLARRVVPCQALYGIDMACNLAAFYAESGYTAAINSAFGITGTAPNDYATLTAGHDPVLRQGWEFRGIPMRFIASSADTTAVKTQNTDELYALVEPFTEDLTTDYSVTGNHQDPSHFIPADAVAFFQRTLSAGNPAAS